MSQAVPIGFNIWYQVIMEAYHFSALDKTNLKKSEDVNSLCIICWDKMGNANMMPSKQKWDSVARGGERAISEGLFCGF